MKYLYRLVAIIGLSLVLIAPITYYYGSLAEDLMKTYMFTGTLLWFSGAIPWLGKKKAGS